MNYIKAFQTNKGIKETALTFEPMIPGKIFLERADIEELQNEPLLEQTLTFSATASGKKFMQDPSGIELKDNGDIIFRLYAKGAHTVSVRARTFHNPPVIELQNNGYGLFEGTLPYNPLMAGPKSIDFFVDGVNVLNPYMPICFHRDRACNYIEIPDPETVDYISLKENIPHGSVTREVYYSETMKDYLRCYVYTPPGYTSEKKYPVLYLQHGSTENETCWIYNGKLPYIMDNLIAEHQCIPFIIVMNNGMIRLSELPQDSVAAISQALLNDCIPYIESKYCVKSTRQYRAIAGLSMGSFQASYIAFTYPEMFSSVGLFSGFLRRIDKSMDYNKNTHLNILRDAPRFSNTYQIFFRSMGEYDAHMKTFLEDDEFCEQCGISSLSCYHRITYPRQDHEWGSWRRAIRDFIPLLFHS